jgi:allantoate deiminase
VLAGLIAIRALKERYGTPKRTLEAVALCEEESSRFPGANFWGSRAITGAISPDEPESQLSFEGETMASAMENAGLDSRLIRDAERDDIDVFIELHIEQGPVLEQAGLPVAVVSAITGLRHYLVELKGTQNHAGAFPMDMRQDPLAGFAEIASNAIDTAHRWGRPAVTTIGRVVPEPNKPAVIPARVEFTIDARHPDPESCEKLYATHEHMMREVAARRNLELSWRITADHAPCLSDPEVLAVLKKAAQNEAVPFMIMASGAGHDTQQMARRAKVAMIFVRSKDGRSHTPEEFSSILDIVAGIRVLAAALHRLAY